ncbi:MAG: hypothetical protein NTX22_15670 [Ignavibacteriales bacterium]|nr:hypothetical protein [Ignavibacteriales bacterium]
MKLIPTLFFLVFVIEINYAQIITNETRTSKDSTGKVVKTESVVISKSEDITPRNNLLAISPLTFILFYNISYYHRFSNNIGGGIGLRLPTISGIDGFGVNAEVRFYPSGKSLKGFYFAPNISYKELRSEGSTITPFSIGGLVGWQFFFGSEFALGVGLGVDYYFVSSTYNDNSFHSYSTKGTFPDIRLDIGYAW